MTLSRTLSTPCAPCKGTGQRIRLNPSWLRHRRKAAGLTLAQVAILCGCSQSYIGAIETGKRECPASIAAQYDAL